MKIHVKIMYIISFVLIGILLLTFHFHPTVEETIYRRDSSINIINDYSIKAYKNEDAPIGITLEYSWTLKDIPAYNGALTFYVVHQEIEAYIEDELVYNLKSDHSSSMTRTVGYAWSKINISPADEGKTIRILVHPIYESSIDTRLTVYQGDVSIVQGKILWDNIPVLIIAFLAIILGIVFMAYVLINIKNTHFDNSLFMLAIFSLAAGLWKLCDMTSAPLIFNHPLTLSTIAISTITLMVPPYLLFIQEQLLKKNSFVWNALITLCLLLSIVVFLLQLLGVADLRETLIFSHVMICVTVCFVMICVIREAGRTKFPPKLKLTVICCLLCLLGVVIDMAVYYYSGNSGNMIYCVLAFLIYAVLMGLMSARETKQLIDRGQQAEHYQNLALHDTLTGLYNRAFYYEFIKNNNVYRESCFIVMMDVNDLKLCNDTLGHDWGDQLLIDSARLIKKAFPIGECIRMGGDEFSILLPESSEAECKLCLDTFDELLEKFNEDHPNGFPVSIAYGYANYVKKIDLDFSDTLRRADKMMYQMKMDMKNYLQE